MATVQSGIFLCSLEGTSLPEAVNPRRVQLTSLLDHKMYPFQRYLIDQQYSEMRYNTCGMNNPLSLTRIFSTLHDAWGRFRSWAQRLDGTLPNFLPHVLFSGSLPRQNPSESVSEHHTPFGYGFHQLPYGLHGISTQQQVYIYIYVTRQYNQARRRESQRYLNKTLVHQGTPESKLNQTGYIIV